LRMVQERRPGRPLKPLDPRLDPAVAAFAERVRAFYTNMHVSLAQIGEALSCDASTLSRYLSGTTLPERGMLDRLYEAVERFTSVPVHEDVRRSTHELFYAACSVKDKPTYELYILKDEKEAAEQRATHAEETVDELQAELQAAHETKQLTEGRLSYGRTPVPCSPTSPAGPSGWLSAS
jgi:transcriptional regulator with XRE-family HTH domain